MACESDLYRAAAQLDESPIDLRNGTAAEALHALEACAGTISEVAARHGLGVEKVELLWHRARTSLQQGADAEDVFASAAEAATLLYVAAWLLEVPAATASDLDLLL